MEHFDQLEGFDQENTSLYSSYNPIKSLENGITDVYNVANIYNPIPTLAQYTSTAYNKLKNTGENIYHQLDNNIIDPNYQNISSNIKNDYYHISDSIKKKIGELRNDTANFDFKNIYASDPTNYTLRKNMQNSYLNHKINNLSHHLQNTKTTTYVPINTNNIIDYNSVILILIILIIFVILKYYLKK